MDKFNVFNFFSKLIADKDAQNSLINIIGKLFSNSQVNNTKPPKKQEYYNENSDVYRSPSSYTLYSDMIKRHDEIAKNIPPNAKT